MATGVVALGLVRAVVVIQLQWGRKDVLAGSACAQRVGDSWAHCAIRVHLTQCGCGVNLGVPPL